MDKIFMSDLLKIYHKYFLSCCLNVCKFLKTTCNYIFKYMHFSSDGSSR